MPSSASLKKHGAQFHVNAPVNGSPFRMAKFRASFFKPANNYLPTLWSRMRIFDTKQRLLQNPFANTKHPIGILASSRLPLILYLGINGQVPELIHHNLLFAEDWKQNFAEIFDNPIWPENPSLYICAPSKTDPSVAPPGKLVRPCSHCFKSQINSRAITGLCQKIDD